MNEKFEIRFVIVNGRKYLRVEDVIGFISRLAESEETDTRNRLNAAASNLKED